MENAGATPPPAAGLKVALSAPLVAGTIRPLPSARPLPAAPVGVPRPFPELRMHAFASGPVRGVMRLGRGLSLALGLLALAPSALAQPPAPGDVVLLDFAASWCGPCRAMAPLVAEIAAAGWPVRYVDVDREGDLVRRFAVTGVPCYVLLVRGEEVGRINGATSRGELEGLLARARVAPQAAPAAPAPAPELAGIPLPAQAPARPLAIDARVPRPAAAPAEVVAPPATAVPVSSAGLPARASSAPAEATIPPAERPALEARLLAATARLRVEEATGVSWATGTVVDCRQGEALILTCGHVFRESKGRGRVEVDLFGPRGQRGLAGQVIAYDLERDVALVSIFTDVPIEPVRVGGGDRVTSAGAGVVTVGCDGGRDASLRYSRVTAVDKYLGPANLLVAGQPVQGRSGGGLFGLDGTLIGVCNAADPTDDQGLFAALPAIHEHLDEAGLAFVYRASYPSQAVAEAAGAAVPALPAQMPAVAFDRRDRSGALPTAGSGPGPDAAGVPAPGGPAPAAVGPRLSGAEESLLEHVRGHGDAEVICIVRPARQSPAATGDGEVFVLQSASREFLDGLTRFRSATVAPPAGPAPSGR
jgi:thiol-disulfide isomerase/thioredoxin